MNCKNCGHDVKGKYCSNCGQDAKVSRISLPNILNQVSESILQINKGFFFTLKQLFLRPGAFLKDFLKGQRQNHYKPIAYLFVLSTVYFLITQITNQTTWLEEFISGWVDEPMEQGKEVQTQYIFVWLSKNYAYSSVILLPLFSLASYLAFFKRGTNYLEHLVINSYITGHQAISYSLFTFIGMFFRDSELIEIMSLVVAMTYTFWVFWQYFSKGNRILNVFRSILTYAFYLVFNFGLLFLTMKIKGN